MKLAKEIKASKIVAGIAATPAAAGASGLNWSALALEGYGSKRHQSDSPEADGGEADGSDKEAGERQVHRR